MRRRRIVDETPTRSRRDDDASQTRRSHVVEAKPALRRRVADETPTTSAKR